MIEIAKNAGFCFGVKGATDRLENAIAQKNGTRLYTLGVLIHNDSYNQGLKDAGVEVVSVEDCAALAQSATEESPVKVFIRAHGIPKEQEASLQTLAEKYPFFSYEDCTCPFVKKIHKIAEQYSTPEHFLVLLGQEDHPEVVGIMSHFDHDKAVFANTSAMVEAQKMGFFEKFLGKTPILVAQTTQNMNEWKKSQEFFEKLYTNALIFDTICSVTETRQTEVEALARRSDLMIVVGGKNSSNTAKLYAICT